MKKSDLKLTQFSKAELKDKQMNMLLGGQCCGCGCHGTSTNVDNQNANAKHSYGSPEGNTFSCWCWNGNEWTSVPTK
jgi:natural product precursor